MKPYFSVVIPLYNKENYIESTLRSVLAQTFSDFEIILVNDGSTDKSFEKAKSVQDHRILFVHQENQGVSMARNHGIATANGKYIALLDADDQWHSDHLTTLKDLISLFPLAGLYCTGYEISINEKECRKAEHFLKNPDQPQLIENYFEASLADPVAWTSAVAFSPKDFYDIGKFDPLLRTGQDIDFFIRAALKRQIAFAPKITLRYYRQSENNLGQSHYNKDRVYLIEKFRKEEKNNLSLKKYLDVNRYAVALRCKSQNDLVWKKLVMEIDPNNLNTKQLFLLKMPKSMLQLAQKTQRFLMKFNIYLTAFK